MTLTGTVCLLWLAVETKDPAASNLCWAGAVVFALMGCGSLCKDYSCSHALSRMSCCFAEQPEMALQGDTISTQGQGISDNVALNR